MACVAYSRAKLKTLSSLLNATTQKIFLGLKGIILALIKIQNVRVNEKKETDQTVLFYSIFRKAPTAFLRQAVTNIGFRKLVRHCLINRKSLCYDVVKML